MVVPRGNAPRSLAYQASALLLSYRTLKLNREASFQGAPRYLYLVREWHVDHPGTPGLAELNADASRTRS